VPTGTSGVFVHSCAFGRGRRGRRTAGAMGAVTASRIGSATTFVGLAASEHSGHQVLRRRSRPGRIPCSVGVAANRCPLSHSQSSSTSAAGGTCVRVMPTLSSGWYCRMSAGKAAHASQ
jgi:hypothetical protein